MNQIDNTATIIAAREQLESADLGATNTPSDKEPGVRALVGIGYALLVIAQELSFIRQTYEEARS